MSGTWILLLLTFYYSDKNIISCYQCFIKIILRKSTGNTCAWEQRKFSDFVLRESVFQASSSEYPSVEYEDVVAEEGRLNKDIRQKETQKTGIVFDGTQVLYGKLRPYLHNWLNPDFTGVAVGDWWVLRPVGADKKFLYRLIQTQQFDEVANQSSGSKMPRADWNLVSNTEFIIPSSLDEQRQIAGTFDDLDNLITLHQREESCAASFSASCFGTLKAFFWEQRKLGDLAVFNPKTDLPDEFEYVDLESVVGTEMLSHRTESKRTAPSRAQRLAQTGDLFYQTVRPYQKNNYLFEKPDRNYVFSTGYAQMRPVTDGRFLLCLVQNECFVKVVLDNCTGTSYPAINSNDLAQIDVYAPRLPQEQRQIGNFFKYIDTLITLHQRERENTDFGRKET